MVDFKRWAEIVGAITATGALGGGVLAVTGAPPPPWAAEAHVTQTEQTFTKKYWKLAQTQQQQTRQIQELSVGAAQSGYVFWSFQVTDLEDQIAKAKNTSLKVSLQHQLDLAIVQKDLFRQQLQSAARASHK